MPLNPFARYIRIIRKVSKVFGYQKPRGRHPRRFTYVREETEVLQLTQKKKALSEAALKEKIQELPAVQVIKVIDGDTVIISKNRRQVRIRLDSIDCPEDGQEWGDIATYGLIKLIGGKRVRLEEHGIDSHGRTLATIHIQREGEWQNVNERMVTLGHAWVMRRFYDHLPKDRQTKLNRLENWAKSKRVGLWSKEDPIPPWQWRNQK